MSSYQNLTQAICLPAVIRRNWGFLCCTCSLLLCASSAMGTLPGNAMVPALFSFGDSIMDTGNNNHRIALVKCDFQPYGRDIKGGVPTGRCSNGKLTSDLTAEMLRIKEFLPAYLDPNLQPNELLTGVAFASAGSGYDPLSSTQSSAISLRDQLQYFKQYIAKLRATIGDERTNFILHNCLVLLVASSVDISLTYPLFRRLNYDIPSYTDLLLESASSLIKELYGTGVRRIGVFSAPPVGCVPFQRTINGGIRRNCAVDMNDAAKLFNSKLSAELDDLNVTLNQSRIVYIDVYDVLWNIIHNPLKYGFKIADKGCCGTGTIEASVFCNKLSSICTNESEYVFWDSYHPTQRTYSIIVDELFSKYVHRFL